MANHQFRLLRRRRFGPFFATQALGAFNDNVFWNALVILVAFHLPGLDGAQVDFHTNLAAALFILPFLLFSAVAGQWAERKEKAAAIRAIKNLEIAVMAAAALALWLQSLPLLLAVLFLSGLQSALFGPLKYSILPQALRPHELVGGNALVEAGTFLAILLGTLAGGWLMGASSHGPLLAGATLLALALLGRWSAAWIPPAPASAPDLRIDWNPLRATLAVLGHLRGRRAVLNSVLGVSWFWLFGAVFLAQLPAYTRLHLGGDATVAPLVLTLFALGIGMGSLLCEALSRRTVEIGLVPLGALGMTVFGIDLYLQRPGPAPATGLDWWAFVSAPGSLRLCLDLLMIGVSGGLFTVPLYALIQQRSPPLALSRIVAANNILNALFMVVAAIGAIILLRAGLSIPQLLLLVAVLNALVAAWIFTLVPEFVARLLSWLVVRLLYRLRLSGLDKVPDQGAALLVCNHVSYMDALLVMGAVPRPTRFVIYYRIHDTPLLRPLFRAARAIPIAGAREDPAVLEAAFEQIDQALAAGELVGIFPEGGLSADGAIAPFRPGLERVLARRPVPVVPMALRGMWSSMWSRRDSRMGRMRLPRRFRAAVELVVGEPVPAGQATAADLEALVRRLRGDRA